MSLSNILITAVPVVGGLAALRWVRPISGPPTPPPTSPSAADYVAQAPAILRPAVAIVSNGVQLDRMLVTLGLGHPQVGFPLMDGWDYDRHGLHVDLLMLGGQHLEDWNNDKTRAQLATYLGVERVTVSSPAPSWVRLQVRVHDTLAATAALPPLAHNAVDLEAVPIGVTEDGDPWLLKLLYRQLVIVGASDSGKGSVLWSIIAGVGPAIKAGLVDVWMADPKGGMEFGRGENRLWKRFHYSAEGILEMLAEAVELMRERAARLKEAKVRKFVPSVEEPVNLLIIDEYAAMSAFATKEQMDEGMRLIGLVLTQGRSIGWIVVAAIQDPSKATMPNRQFFMTRIGLHLDEPGQNDMIHGRGAKARGALCDEIPTDTPGVAYVAQSGTTGFLRVRAYWVSDEAADAIVDTYGTPEITGPSEDYSGFDPDDLGDEEPGDGAAVAA